MMKGMIDRDEAIQLLCYEELAQLSPEQRAEQLKTMRCECWEDHPLWETLPADVRAEFAEPLDLNNLRFGDPCNPRYDSVLLLGLAFAYRGVRNEYLLTRLREAGHVICEIQGHPTPLCPCPCCGYRTLDSRGDFDICPVCWWEDGGRDNQDANWIDDGPNGVLSLTRARINFLRDGIKDPSRDDLRKWQEPREKYERGRTFLLDSDGQTVREPADGWSASLEDEHRDWRRRKRAGG